MKMKWNQGRPEKSGYYLSWNTLEDVYPVVLHCSCDNGQLEWWTYYTHEAVLNDIKNQIYFDLKNEITSFLSENLNKSEKIVLEKIINKIDSIDLNEDKEIILEYKLLGNACLYDVARPDYWAELPYLFDVDNDSYNPNEFDIEIEDAKAQAISKMTSDIEYILGKTLSELKSPFEKTEAPWKFK